MTLEFAGGHEEQPWLWKSSTTVRGVFIDITEESAIVLLLDMESPIILSDMDESAIILSAGMELAIMPSDMAGLAIILSEMGVLDMPPSMEESDMSDPMDFLGMSPGMHTSFDFLDRNMGFLKQVKTLFMMAVVRS